MKKISSQHWASDPEKVEAYVLHRIDESERVACTAHLNQCEECRHIVQEERELIAGIRHAGRNAMKLRLKKLIQRDSGKQFDWTQAASLAAAIVLMLGAVFIGRWFFDTGREKTQVREIVLQESKPEERAMWIIGKVIEIKDKSSYLERSRTSAAPLAAGEVEYPDHDRSDTETNQKVMAESKTEVDEAVISPAEESPVLVQQEKSEMHDVENSKTKETPAVTERMELKSRSDVSSKVMQSTAPMAKKMTHLQDSIDTETKGNLTLAVEDKLGSKIGFDSDSKRMSVQASEIKSEMRKPNPAKIKTDSRIITRKIVKVKNTPPVFVRRGDMNDLPASLKNEDASVIHTRLERTPKGVLLIFYSNAITDSAATDVEAIAPDSIIVTFRNRQVAYHIPGGWAGKM